MKTVIYACDENYVSLTLVSCTSLLVHNPATHIVLLGFNLSEESFDLVRNQVVARSGTFTAIDVSEQIQRLAAAGTCAYVSYAVYARLFIADMLKNEHGKVLYLDCDTLVRGSLDELFSLDLHGHATALGFDCVHKRYKTVVNLPSDKAYYNSGVMLIDLDAWRAHHCTETLLSEIDHPHGRNPLGDQDIIVRALNDDIAPLSPRFNFLSQFFMLDYGGVQALTGKRVGCFTSKAEYNAAKADPVVCHFSGNTFGRPWCSASRHPLRAEYREACETCDVTDLSRLDKPLPLAYQVQYLLWHILPQWLFNIANRLLLRTHLLVTYHR